MLGKSDSRTSSDSSARQRLEGRAIGVIDTGYDTEYSDSVLARMNRVNYMTKYCTVLYCVITRYSPTVLVLEI